MKRLADIVAAVALGLVSVVAPTAHAETTQVRCTHRSDRPDLGSPVPANKGGRSLRQRLPNGYRVIILRTDGSWHRIRYNDPRSIVRSEPLRVTGWMSSRYLKAVSRRSDC